MSHSIETQHLSIIELPSILVALCERAGVALLPGVHGPIALFIRYLRRKPGRGLAIMYSLDEPSRKKKPQANSLNCSVSLTLAESALEGVQTRLQKAQIQQVTLSVQYPGIIRSNELGISVQVFPADDKLPALAASCDPSPGSLLWQALEKIALEQLGDVTWRLVSANAQPVRYKPASRCVLRYHLIVERRQADTISQNALTIYGKLYATVEQARRVQAMTEALYADQVSQENLPPLLPRPLGLCDIPGLTFTEAVEPADLNNAERQVHIGHRVFQAQIEHGCGGSVNRVILPEAELRLTAGILAQLHTSGVPTLDLKMRAGVQEARKVRERAALLAGYMPQMETEAQQLAQRLAVVLEMLQPEMYRPAHGGFKPSQLLFHSQHVFVTDFDGLCLADPALDIGYFLAYLRPGGFWYDRPGTRQWFEAASNIFVHAYQQSMLERGIDEVIVSASITRAAYYEAAILFKIATRRVNRLNSPRPQELAAILGEIALCFSEKVRN